MATLDDLLFEVERRIIVFHKDTSMPDESQLGYTGDPNNAVNGNTDGETLLHNCPSGSRYLDKGSVPHARWVKVSDAPGGDWVEEGAALGEEVAHCCQGLFVTNVGNDGSGIVGNKIYLADTVPANTVVTEATTDDDTVRIYFLVEGRTGYSPTVTVDGTVCTNLAQYSGDRRMFYGSVPVTVTVTRDVTLVTNDGATAYVTIHRAASGPEITDMSFTGGYPGSQTEVKENDEYDVIFTFEPTGTEPVSVTINNTGACKGETISLASTELDWGTTYTATVTVTINATSTTVHSLPCVGFATNSLGTNGATVATNEASGTVDGDDLIKCNDVIPQFAFTTINYPSSQSAFKANEAGSVEVTVTEYSSVVYSSPNSDFVVTTDTTYAQTKPITCTNPGTYNDSTDNYRIVAQRAANATSAIYNLVVEVADTAPLLTVTQPQTRLRSSAAGTDYTITATSNQNLAGAPDLDVPVSGTWQGAGFAGGSKVFTRDIQIDDDDVSGITAWGWQTTAPTNNAGISATITGDENVGGFISRQLVLAAFGTAVDLDTAVVDTAKLAMTWSFKDNMVFKPIGTAAPVVYGWTIDALNSNPTEVKILDTQACNASTQASVITIEETV